MPEQEYEPFEPKPKKAQNKKPAQDRKWYTPIQVNTHSLSLRTTRQWFTKMLSCSWPICAEPSSCNKMWAFWELQKSAMFTDWPLCIFELLPCEFQITEVENFAALQRSLNSFNWSLNMRSTTSRVAKFSHDSREEQSPFWPYLCIISCKSTNSPSYQCAHTSRMKKKATFCRHRHH